MVELGPSVSEKPSLHPHQILKTIPPFPKTSLLLDSSTSVVLLAAVAEKTWNKLLE